VRREVEVVGQQWNFSYSFSRKDGVLGTTNIRLASPENPFAIDPNDPKGQDDVLVSSPNCICLLGKPVKVLLRARIPAPIRVTAVSGQDGHGAGHGDLLLVNPTRTGTFDALCEQLCGAAHFTMRGRVIVDEEKDFQAWLATQPTYAQTRAAAAGDVVGRPGILFVCSACHGSQGEGNPQLNAPKLAGQAGWYLERQLQDFKIGIRGAARRIHTANKWSRLPRRSPMHGDKERRCLYQLLADASPQGTVSGNPEKGAGHYETCAYCHGSDGQGVWSTNAPRLSHMKRLVHEAPDPELPARVRGSHPKILAGADGRHGQVPDGRSGDQ